MRVSPLAVTVALFIDIIRNQTHRPHLSVVGMPAELQVDAGSFCVCQVIGLVIQQDDGTAFIDILHQFL